MSVAFKDIQSPLPKHNCWEFLKCGRETAGENIEKLGICPASTDTFADGLNGGKNGGRICWAISGTYSNKEIEGLYAKRQLTCRACIFFKKVKEEEEAKHFHLDKAPCNSISSSTVPCL
jgi:hypothetical protein